MNFENIYIILVEPETPGNIGSVARAMKNMGLSNLRLVNPCDTDTKELRMRSSLVSRCDRGSPSA